MFHLWCVSRRDCSVPVFLSFCWTTGGNLDFISRGYGSRVEGGAASLSFHVLNGVWKKWAAPVMQPKWSQFQLLGCSLQMVRRASGDSFCLCWDSLHLTFDLCSVKENAGFWSLHHALTPLAWAVLLELLQDHITSCLHNSTIRISWIFGARDVVFHCYTLF